MPCRGGGAPAAARRLEAALSALAGPGADQALADFETRLLSALPGRLDALRRSLDAGPVALGDLPDGLRQRGVAADGRARITVYPKENLHDREALERFVVAVRGLAPGATGSPVVILEAGNTVVAAFRDAAMIAVVSIALLLAVLLRSPRDIFLVFAPLALAALLTIAASVLFDLPFNFANVIVFAAAFRAGRGRGHPSRAAGTRRGSRRNGYQHAARGGVQRADHHRIVRRHRAIQPSGNVEHGDTFDYRHLVDPGLHPGSLARPDGINSAKAGPRLNHVPIAD